MWNSLNTEPYLRTPTYVLFMIDDDDDDGDDDDDDDDDDVPTLWQEHL